MDLKSVKIGFIGGGNMARAIGVGLIEKGIVDPKNISVSAKTETTLDYWKNLGTFTSFDNQDIISRSRIIFLAIKPQVFATDFPVIQYRIESRKLFVSVLVGITMERLISGLNITMHERNASVGIIRAMPNTPLRIGSGITVYCGNNGVELPEYNLVHELFSHLGLTQRVHESQINAIGALAGSGPAFAYQIVEALSDGAVMSGVPRELATKFAAQVLVGAGKMVLETGRHPGQLKDDVCSAGGTTITGVHALEQGGLRAALMNAIKAAVARSQELGS